METRNAYVGVSPPNRNTANYTFDQKRVDLNSIENEISGDSRHWRDRNIAIPLLTTMSTTTLGDGSELIRLYFGNLGLLDECVHTIDPFLQRNVEFRMFGKRCVMQRGQRLVGSPHTYRFSGVTFESIVPEGNLVCFQKLLSAVNQFCGSKFTHILVNEYKDGTQYISDHADDESEIDPENGVVTLSYGATRRFVIKDKKTKRRVTEVPLISGEMVMMKGKAFQQLYTHGVPMQRKVKEPRYSFTFRAFY